MQFSVPQFTDVEDKLIGPLTLKQFLVLVAAGGLCLLFWSLPIPKLLAILIDLPIAIVGLALAFATYNGRPALSYIFPFMMFLVSPKRMVFKRETNITQINTQVEEAPKPVVKEVEPEESADSRLRKLAYLLDHKTAEEQELINKSIAQSVNISLNNPPPERKIEMPQLPSMKEITKKFTASMPAKKKEIKRQVKVVKAEPAKEINTNQISILDL